MSVLGGGILYVPPKHEEEFPAEGKTMTIIIIIVGVVKHYSTWKALSTK